MFLNVKALCTISSLDWRTLYGPSYDDFAVGIADKLYLGNFLIST